MAENLPEDAELTVLTNSITIAEVLRKNEYIRYFIGR